MLKLRKQPGRGAITAIVAVLTLAAGYLAADIASGADGRSPGASLAIATTVRRPSPTVTRTPGATYTPTARPTTTMTPPPARVPSLITTTPAAVLVTVTSISGSMAPTPEVATPTGIAAARPTLAPPPAATAVSTQAPTSTPTAATSSAVIHVVQANETVWGIAQKYGVTVDEVLAANQMDRQSVLQIGQKLTIPPKR